ncbi:hypothetical protein [Kitasatospora sp. NPDC057223]|uniref:hypothetical protein n=1 Tax=Kitasatospora sp. NPDC057223 TaxID=3346055 RepID=UPI003638B270
MGSSTFGSDSGVESTIALLGARLPAVREQRRRLEEELAAVIAQESSMTSVLDGLRALSGTPLDGQDEPRDTAQPAVEAEEAAAGAGEAPVQSTAADSLSDGPADAETASPEPAAKPARRTTGRAATARPAAKKATTTKATTTRATARKATAGKATATKVAATKTAVPGPEQDATPEPSTEATAGKAAPKATAPDTAPEASKRKVPTPRKAAPEQAVDADVPAPAKAPAAGRRRLTDVDEVLSVLSRATDPLRARAVTELLGLDAVDANIKAIRTRLERLAKGGQAQRAGRGLYTVAGAAG